MNRTVQTSFTAGMLDANLQSHLDLAIYRNGAAEILNCRVLPQGGVTNRGGTVVEQRLSFDDYQIEPFIFNDTQKYAFLFRAGGVTIWDAVGKTSLLTLPGPWTADHVLNNELRVIQQLDTMIVAHKDFETRTIVRKSFGIFEIATLEWSTDADNLVVWQPYHKYAAKHIRLRLSDSEVGAAQAITSHNYFLPEHVGLKIRYRKKQITVVNVIDPKLADVTIDEKLHFTTEDSPTTPVPVRKFDYDWDEQAFSALHGWPRCFALHMQRLWLGGGRDCPSTLWGSTLDDPFSTNLGTGADDEAIKYSIYADRVSAIVSMVSNGFLQIFTTGGEFYVPTPDSKALTPSTMAILPQSMYGCANLQARQFDQTTIFVTRKAQGVREFSFDAVQGSFAADALTFMSKSLLTSPRDLDVQMEGYDEEQECRAYISNTDGTIAVLSKVRKENIAGWSYWTTQGAFKRVGVIDSEVWLIVERTVNGRTDSYLEILSNRCQMDFSVTDSGAASTEWGPYPYHKNTTVHVRSGDLYLGEFTTDVDGMLSLPLAVSDLELGFHFESRVAPLQQHVLLPDGVTLGEPKRYVSLTAFLEDTMACRIKNRNLPLDNDDPGLAPARYTGPFRAMLLGWAIEKQVFVRRAVPLPMTINALVTEVEI